MSNGLGLVVGLGVMFLIFVWMIISAMGSEKAKTYGRSANKWFFFGIFGVIMFLVMIADETPMKVSQDSGVPQEPPHDETPKTNDAMSPE